MSFRVGLKAGRSAILRFWGAEEGVGKEHEACTADLPVKVFFHLFVAFFFRSA